MSDNERDVEVQVAEEEITPEVQESFERSQSYEGSQIHVEQARSEKIGPSENDDAYIVKIAFSGVNSIIFCFGFIVFALGIWVMASKPYMSTTRENDTDLNDAGGVLLIITGMISAIVALLGQFSVWKNMKILNIVYFAVMLILSILMLIGGITTIVYKNQVLPHLRESMEDSIPHYRVKPFVTKAWDTIQEDMKCCGVKSSNSSVGWKAWSTLNPKMFNGNRLVPISCCKPSESQDQILRCYSQPDGSNANIDDCLHKVKDKIKKVAPAAGGIAIAFGLCQLVGAFLACILVIKA